MEEYIGVVISQPIINWEWSMLLWLIPILLLVWVGKLMWDGKF